MQTKEKKNGRKRWILLGILMAAVIATASLATSETLAQANRETPGKPTPARAQAMPFAAGDSVTAGAFTLTGNGISSSDYSYASNLLTIKSSKAMTIQNTNAGETADRIKIQLDSSSQAAGANLILNGVNINTDAGPAMEIEGSATYNVNITLQAGANNILKTTSNVYAGLQKNGDSDGIGKLTIGGTGSLEATGGHYGAGIGSGGCSSATEDSHPTRNITIDSGRVTATGTVGIGSGSTGLATSKPVSDITINGGTVNATGTSGAGIGATNSETVSSIHINGGTVTAQGGGGAPGIGASGGTVSSIYINSGTVTATGGEIGAAGIGGSENVRDIKIYGGTVTAIGTTSSFGRAGAGIGGGGSGTGSNIKITGGIITAIGGEGAAAIGSGNGGTGSTGNSLNGNAVVMATGGSSTLDTLDGFAAGDLKQGIAFTRKGNSGDWTAKMYGSSVAVTADTTFPAAALTIASGKTLTVNDGVTVTVSDGATLHNAAGTLNANKSGYGTIICQGTGKVTVQMDYEAHGGTGGPTAHPITYQDKDGANKKYDAAADLAAPTPPTGKVFAGWYSDDTTFTSQVTKDTLVDSNLHKLFAKWMDPQTCTVTFDTKGGSPASWTEQVIEGQKVDKPASDPTKAGYTFTGWYENGKPYDFNRAVTSDLTIYAAWLGNEHTISVPEQPIGGTIVITSTARTGDTVTFTATPDSGYRMKGLPQVNTTDASMNGSIPVTPTGNANECRFEMPNSAVDITAEFELAPQPSPTPTPDPGKGGNGLSHSAKTGDLFAGGISFAILGMAAAAGIALKKRK